MPVIFDCSRRMGFASLCKPVSQIPKSRTLHPSPSPPLPIPPSSQLKRDGRATSSLYNGRSTFLQYILFSGFIAVLNVLTWLLQYGRPFIIVREQGKKKRMHGPEAIKVGNLATRLRKESGLRRRDVTLRPTFLQLVLSPTFYGHPLGREV